MTIRKYEFTGEKQVLKNGTEVSQIRALRDIARFSVKEGDLGGWIQFSENLLEDNDCWVDEDAIVYGVKTVVRDKAYIGGTAILRSSYDAHSILSGECSVTGKVDIMNSVLTGEAITLRGQARLFNCRFYGEDIIVEGAASLSGITIMETAKKVRISGNAILETKLLQSVIHADSVTIKDNARLIDVNRIIGKNFTACDDSVVEGGVTFTGRNIHLSGASCLSGKLTVDSNVRLSECATIFNDTDDILTILLVELGGDVILHASTLQ